MGAAALAVAGCALDATQRAEGPAEIRLAPYTRLQVARTPEVLGVVLTHNEAPPRMMIIFAKSRDARGQPEIELVGWDEAPAARSFIDELLLARQKSGSGTDFH
jgi:uncharacterized membrane-anchored protein